MALNLNAVGEKIGPVTKTYGWRDVVLYALGVGAGFDNLDYCTERNLKAIPSFAVASIIDFFSQIGATSNIDLAGILHGEQELIFHKPIPVEGTLSTTGAITHIYDKGEKKGALVMAESDTHHSNGSKLFTSIITLFARRDGGFGGENAPKKEFVFPEREPDIRVTAVPQKNQPLLYRLSGDLFPLHADPEFARMSGFEMPIMHGLCTHGYACRALVDSLIPGEPEKARRMFCRFAKTLYPGTPIETHIWKIAEGQAFWRVINSQSGEIIINNGIFEYGPIPSFEIRFDNRVAVITGAGGGLGRVYALALAKRGAKVVVNDFGGSRDGSSQGSSSPADEVVREIEGAGGKAVANYDNVATAQGGQNIIQTALDHFGSVDILINNAGILRDKSFTKMEPSNWSAVMDVHLNGAYNVTRPAFKVMKEKGYGRILMTTSAAGLYGNFGQTNYAAAKMGLVGMMNSLKIEGRKHNINVNTIAPLAASRLTEDIMPPDVFEKMDPAYVSALAVYLCSDLCNVSGNIYNAGMGFYNRAAILTGKGKVIESKGCDDSMPGAETVWQNLDSIRAIQDGKTYDQLNDIVGEFFNELTAASHEK